MLTEELPIATQVNVSLRVYNSSGWKDGWMDEIDPYWLSFPPPPILISLLVGLSALALTILATLLNLAVLRVYHCNPTLNRHLRVYVIALAASDLASSLLSTWMFALSSLARHWLFGRAGCRYYAVTQGTSALFSLFVATAVAAERAALLRWRIHRKRPRIPTIALSAAAIWALSLTAPPLLGWNGYRLEAYLTSCCFDFLARSSVHRAYLLFLFLGGFFLPLSILGPASAALLRSMRFLPLQPSAESNGERRTTMYVDSSSATRRNRSSEQPQLSNGTSQGLRVDDHPTKRVTFSLPPELRHKHCDPRPRLRRRQWRISVLVLLVPTVFLLIWTPYALLTLLAQSETLTRRLRIPPGAFAAVSLLAKTSNLANPVLYAFVDKPFRKALLHSCSWRPHYVIRCFCLSKLWSISL